MRLRVDSTLNTETKIRVKSDLIRHLYKPFLVSQGASTGAVIAVVIGVWNEISSPFLLLWLSLHVAVMGARILLLVAYYLKQPISDERMLAWEYYFTVGAATGGAVWGWAAHRMMEMGGDNAQVLLPFVLGGILVGSAQALASSMRSYIAFSLPLVLPSVVVLFMQHHGQSNVMSFLLLLFLVSSLAMARVLNRELMESFSLRYENIHLVRSLGDQVRDRERSEAALRMHKDILEMLTSQHSAQVVLNAVIRMVESQVDGAIGGVLLRDPSGKRLQIISAPRLPSGYQQLIGSMLIAPNAISCANAVYQNEAVFVADIATSPQWEDYRDIALAHGLRACHCMPIRDVEGSAIGVFALYFQQIHTMTEDELASLQAATNLAGVVAERTKAEGLLRQMAHYDALTGLPNRTLFMDRLKQELAWAKRSKQRFALLFIDLDKFKAINDHYGHGIGDLVLKEVANRMRSCVRDADTAARMGGDEFMVLISAVLENRAPLTVANKLIALLSEPIRIEQQVYQIGASIGISIYPSDALDEDKLIGMADAAMYHAKQKGGNTCVYYSSI